MKKVLLACACLLFLACGWMALGVIETLGLTKTEAEQRILDNLAGSNNSVPYTLVQAFKKVAVANRAETVRALGDFAKAYVNSEACAKAYRERVGGGAADPSQVAQLEETVKSLRENVASMEKAVPTVPASYQTMLKKQIEEMRQTVKSYEVMLNQAKYGKRPKDELPLKLEKFLKDTEGLPWNAQLVTRNNKKYFADPALENMPSQRKFYYRCGKETIEAARAYAQAWLKELQAAPAAK
jgi:hypothetical protein